MGCKEAYEICQHRWQDEVDYAETLRERRKLYTTLLVVAVSFGVFRIDLYVDPNHVAVINHPAAIWFMKICTIGASVPLFISVIWLYSSGQKDENTPKRASEYLELSAEEIDQLIIEEEDVSMRFKIERLRRATLELSDGNRRISSNLKLAAVLIGSGYALLTIHLVAYILFR